MKYDLTGQKFGRWTVIAQSTERLYGGERAWVCKCECGTEQAIASRSLRIGNSKSCGCLRHDTRSNFKHGHSRVAGETKEYNAWLHAKQRCYNPNNAKYEHYGARGITMCEKWRNDFAAFLADMGPCPKGLTLERNEVNGHYSPENCVWASYSVQNRNRRPWHRS